MAPQQDTVLRLLHNTYAHIKDTNTSVTRLVTGPATLTLSSHESLVLKPTDFHVLKPNEYALLENPAILGEDGVTPETDRNGQVRVRLGEKKIIFYQEPFPLQFREKLLRIAPLEMLTSSEALVLKANATFVKEGVTISQGDSYLFRGPGTYIPRVEEDVVERRASIVLKKHSALHLQAVRAFTDVTGKARKAGEKYMWTTRGDYLLDVYEKLLAKVDGLVLSPKVAVHVNVDAAFFDQRSWANTNRVTGETYMLTSADTDVFIPTPSETVAAVVPLVVLSRRQWAVILDPIDANGRPQLGRRKVVTDCQFFLKPGESLEGGRARDVIVLSSAEALLLEATEEVKVDGTSRQSGERWLLKGPCSYIPPSEIRIVADPDGGLKRHTMVLSATDGVYVRNIQSGEIRVVADTAYMLAADEELWEKDVPPKVEAILSRAGPRDRKRAITYTIPHQCISQIYDFKKRSQRIVAGPQLVMLGPDEQFTVLSLSGSPWDATRPLVCLPKQTGYISSLYLILGPSTLSDVVKVETSDHAVLQLQLCFDWHFDASTEEAFQKCFSVPDFVGDCCSCIASRVRATLASTTFEKFHKHSADILKAAVFGVTEDGSINYPLRFKANGLVVTSVDIQDICVLDVSTRAALQKSVDVAIELTTQSQENVARQVASVREQEARGRLEKQKINDMSQAESIRKQLLELETQNNTISRTGKAKAVAKARADAVDIGGQQTISCARSRADMKMLMQKSIDDTRTARQMLEIEFQKEKNELKVAHDKAMAAIENGRVDRVMTSIGQDTLTQLSRAGPELQAKLLKAMGIEGYLVTDGKNPINLFNTANGMSGSGAGVTPPTPAPTNP